jgi:ornithine carbamoyltransferase
MSVTTLSRRRSGDLLRIADLDPDGLDALLDLATAMRAAPRGWLDAQPGGMVACYFAKPSTRTRVSFEGAAWRLGLLPVMLRPDELQLGRGEPISDTARVLSSYAAAIVVRTFAQADVEEMARAADVPVINALTDSHHPCQALADLLTLRARHGELAGVRLAYVGDGNNVAHSLMEAGALAGMDVRVATPVGYEPDAEVVARAEALAVPTGGRIVVTHDPREAVRGVDAVYTDVWVSMGEDAERERRLRDLRPYQVDEALLALAAPDAVFLHCLPAHRGEEVTAAVIDGPRSVVFEQAANRLPTEQAVLQTLLVGRDG